MAYDFTAASSQHLTTTSTPVTAPPLTMACWFNAKDVTTTGTLMGIGISAGGADQRYNLFHAGTISGDPIRFFVSATSIDTTAGYSANTWNHACGVAVATNSRIVYLNGGNSATVTGEQAVFTPTQITVGSRFLSSYGGFANALIAEAGIWNVALTADEIASLAKGMTCDKVRPQSLVYYAPLVRDLQDVRGGLTITNNNTATVANHPRVYA